MPTFVTRCRVCAREFEPDADAIRAGSWRLRPGCQPQHSDETRRERGGRVLRTTGRRLCLSYLGAPAL